MKLQGKTILITGGSAGVGLALTEQLHKDNKVIICGRNQAKLDEVKQRFSSVQAIQADLSITEDLNKLVAYIRNHAQDLSVLINNAGVQFNYSFLQDNDLASKVKTEVAINLTAPLMLTTQLLPILVGQPKASIVNITSGLALAPKKSAAVYCGTKAGLRSYGQAFRYQLEDEAPHIKLTEAILPMVDTDMTAGRGSVRMKVSAETVATEIIQAVEQTKSEARVGPVKAFMLLNQLLPFVTRRMFRNS